MSQGNTSPEKAGEDTIQTKKDVNDFPSPMKVEEGSSLSKDL